MTEQEALMLAQAGIDGSGTLLIDADTRSIYVPESEKFFGVESDQNVERKKFKCPKIVGDNIDLSTLHLYINYQNGNGNKDSYMIQDMAVSGEYITFSWVLSRNVAEYKGTVRFVFCAKKADSSGNLVNEWNTTVAEGEVIEGLEATVTVADNNPDIIEQMLTLLKNVSDEPVFTEARTRENVTNGDKVPVLWGKVKKWFADLGTAAFCKVVNNLTTVAEGGVLDARQGKELNDALAKLNKLMGNTDISSIGDGTVTDALRTLNSKAGSLDIGNGKGFAIIPFSITDGKKGSIELENLSTYKLIASHASVGSIGEYIITSYEGGGQIFPISKYAGLVVSIDKTSLMVDAETNNVNVRTVLYRIGYCG